MAGLGKSPNLRALLENGHQDKPTWAGATTLPRVRRAYIDAPKWWLAVRELFEQMRATGATETATALPLATTTL